MLDDKDVFEHKIEDPVLGPYNVFKQATRLIIVGWTLAMVYLIYQGKSEWWPGLVFSILMALVFEFHVREIERGHL